jgi:mannosyltransferase PIG-V
MDNTVEADEHLVTTRSGPGSLDATIQSTHIPVIGVIDKTPVPASLPPASLSKKAAWIQWHSAFKSVLPIYISIHLVFFVIASCSVLFVHKDFSTQPVGISTVWGVWLHWDSINFRAIAVNGYTASWLTAFFPLYPLLVRGVMYVTHDFLTAGLLVSNFSGLGLLMVLYRLVQEDFDAERASRTVLYLSVFPLAFFLAAAYSESLFLLLVLLGFYHMRHGNWWLAGLFACLSVLTRATGICLLIPLCYEYARQHDFNLRNIRLDSISVCGAFAGLGIYALYVYFRFHDPLAFSHAEILWNRKLTLPGYAILRSIKAIIISPTPLNFQSLRNILDLLPVLFLGTLVVLCFVGPWKFPRALSVYAISGAAFFLFAQLFPFGGLYPLESIPRYLLPVFPAFIVLAGMGKNRTIDAGYLLISGSLLFILLAQFLTGHWIT